MTIPDRNHSRLTKIILLVVAAGLFAGLNSCVYFNTFYNANQHYKAAEKENENLQEGQFRAQNYNKAIDTAAKIPENWPESKYVDNALLLMGICYYKIGNYPKAQRKFEEIITNYPETELLDEAALYKGKCLIENRSFDEARDVLTALSSSNAKKEIVREANFALGELLFSEEKYIQAADIYSRIAENTRNKEIQSRASLLAAECYTFSDNYPAAAQAYEIASKYRKNTRQVRFDARFNRAVSLRKSGDIEGAEEVLEDILKDQKLFEFHSVAKVELADIGLEKGNVEEAVEELEKVIEEKPKTDESARAHYIMGIINRKHFEDYTKAEEHLNSVSNEKSDSPYADSAEVALKILIDWRETLAKIDSLGNLILADENFLAGIIDTTETLDTTDLDDASLRSLFGKEEEGEIESPEEESRPEFFKSSDPPSPPKPVFEPESEKIIAPPDTTIGASALTDSLLSDSTAVTAGQDTLQQEIPEPAPILIDTLAILEGIEKNRENIDVYRFQLAEILFFQIENTDSSKILLNALADSANKFKTENDSAAVDSLNHLLIDKYPSTEYALAAGNKLGISLENTQVDSGEIYFKIAEELLFEQDDYLQARVNYTLVDSLYPESDYAPKSLYALAYIYRDKLEDDSLAIMYYKLLAEKFPDDTLAVIAAKRTKEPVVAAPGTVVEPDTIDLMEEYDEPFLPDEVDFLPVCEKDSTEITQMILDLNLYPQRGLSAQQSGIVVLKLTVDVYGYVVPDDIEIVKDVPPGYGFGDAAVEAVQELIYTPGKLGGRPVPVRIEQRVIFHNK